MFFNMFLKCIGFFIFLFVTINVNGQVCTRRAVVTSTMRVPYVYTIREQYHSKCWYGGQCTKTRTKTNVGYRIVTRKEIKVIQICCNGYIRDEAHPDEVMTCLPICMPPCKNGYCVNPGQCACNDDGYTVDPANPHKCLPICSQGCDHGICIAPNTCECGFGYALNLTCQPICTEPCGNGKCIAPDTCECLDGFRKSENNTCEPYCSKGCVHGMCVQPEICACEDGYELNDEQCLPNCKVDCGNGTCISPDTCECDPGYHKENGTCNPICTNGCENGYCAEPLTCACNPGYTSDGNTCRPFCRDDCGNGKCIAPDTCECDIGYSFNGTCDPLCCEPICNPSCIHGSCVEPNFCTCDFGYSKNFDFDTCVPHCSINCGHGKCIAPETCECDPGYTWEKHEEDNDYVRDPVCDPICIGCEETCIGPFNCVCNDDALEARNESVDGENCNCFENCSDLLKQCVRTVCIPKSTTELSTEVSLLSTALDNKKESSVDKESRVYFSDHYSYYYDNMYPEVASVSDVVSSSSVTPSYNPISQTTERNIIVNSSFTHIKTQWDDVPTSNFVWIYTAIAIILILMVAMAFVLMIKRKWLKNFFQGGSYVVEEKSENASASIDMNFIAAKKST